MVFGGISLNNPEEPVLPREVVAQGGHGIVRTPRMYHLLSSPPCVFFHVFSSFFQVESLAIHSGVCKVSAVTKI